MVSLPPCMVWRWAHTSTLCICSRGTTYPPLVSPVAHTRPNSSCAKTSLATECAEPRYFNERKHTKRNFSFLPYLHWAAGSFLPVFWTPPSPCKLLGQKLRASSLSGIVCRNALTSAIWSAVGNSADFPAPYFVVLLFSMCLFVDLVLGNDTLLRRCSAYSAITLMVSSHVGISSSGTALRRISSAICGTRTNPWFAISRLECW